jgi:hypothetical protein
MLESQATKFRRKAAECSRNAEKAAGSEDKVAWLKLAEDWSKLAEGEDLSQEWQRIRAARLRASPGLRRHLLIRVEP